MSRILQGLLAICILLLVALGILFYRQVPRSQTPFKDAIHADTFDLSEGTHTVHLVLGSSWTVRLAGFDAPADNAKAKNVLSSLATVQVEDEISDRADRAAEFEVDAASGVRVALFQKNAKRGEGIFGKQAPDFTHIYFQYVGRTPIYLARGIARGELEPVDPNGWRSRDITNLTEADIQSVTEQPSAGRSFSLQRSSNTWLLDRKAVDPSRVYTLLGTLSHLRAEDFIDPTQPIPASVVTVTIESRMGRTVLHLGAENTVTKRFPLTVESVPGGFWIADDKAHAILVKPSDFKPAKTGGS